ncbi:hypothetical protein BEN47_04095 [Hymenobacter lapidarius]|uniref:Uncharacterized protein n=1 Tax=Hymenobacter lapidarius TaxID=1908237 RepID=A0A1G1SVC7_9BACT|nr:hypothetical protein [Hymenobacter lapidarius]OGX82573.1 hypothetical protein BEN47_04095 [Hymenobacter lapidarius]
MKNLLIALRLAFIAVVALAVAPAAHAQVNINVGPPSWGPAVASGQQYYFIPETNGFYDVPARQYVVRRDGRWIRTSNLSGYNTANFHPVIVDYVGAQPWTRYDEYQGKYGKKRNPSNGGLPPGQAKKVYRQGYSDGRNDVRRRYDNGHDQDDHGKYKDHGKHDYKDHGKYKGKGKKDKD